MKKIIIILFLILFSSSIYAEIVVCKLKYKINSSNWDSENKSYEYKYFRINDHSKTIKIFKKIYSFPPYDQIIYDDEELNKIIPGNTKEIYENPLKVLYFSDEEIIYEVIPQEEIGERNKQADIFNEENKNEDGTYDLTINEYQLKIDTHHIYQIDRIMGFHLTTGISVNEDGSYKLSDKGFVDITHRETEPCYGKNFINEWK